MYNAPMDEVVDEIAILVLCVMLLIWQGVDFFAPVGCAAVVAMACLCHCLMAPGRVGVQCLFYIGAAFWTDFAIYLPVAVYAALRERSWVVRLLWLVPLAVQVVRGVLLPVVLLCLAVLCAVAAVMAIRAVRSRSERDGLRFAYDDMRERQLALRTRLDELQDQQWGVAPVAHGDHGVQAAQVARCGFTRSKPEDLAAFMDLTERELAVVRLVAQGMDNREIANNLFLAEGTVRNHISTILAKKGLANRTQLAVAYYRGMDALPSPR